MKMQTSLPPSDHTSAEIFCPQWIFPIAICGILEYNPF